MYLMISSICASLKAGVEGGHGAFLAVLDAVEDEVVGAWYSSAAGPCRRRPPSEWHQPQVVANSCLPVDRGGGRCAWRRGLLRRGVCGGKTGEGDREQRCASQSQIHIGRLDS